MKIFNKLFKNENDLVKAIISALPNDFAIIKTQFCSCYVHDIKIWDSFPDYRIVVVGYPGKTYFEYKKRGQNFKISGLEIYSDKNKIPNHRITHQYHR